MKEPPFDFRARASQRPTANQIADGDVKSLRMEGARHRSELIAGSDLAIIEARLIKRNAESTQAVLERLSDSQTVEWWASKSDLLEKVNSAFERRKLERLIWVRKEFFLDAADIHSFRPRAEVEEGIAISNAAVESEIMTAYQRAEATPNLP